MATTQSEAAAGRGEPRHGWRIFFIWIVLALAADLVLWFIWYPHLPPGRMSDSARPPQFDIAVLAGTGAPVVVAVGTYFLYPLVGFPARPGGDGDGRAMR